MGIYIKHGKEVLHKEQGVEGHITTHIADAKDEEAAHLIAKAANKYDDFDYMAEADRTCSVIFAPENIYRNDFVQTLKTFIAIAEQLNLYKKLLFRGKTPSDLGMLKPLLHESLAVEFDPMNSTDTTINVIHGSVGVMTEAGEVAELLLKAIEHAERDDVNVLEECGDMMWYIARMLRGVGSDFDHCGKTNINKLRGRHGETFNVERDHNRNLEGERMQLEQDASAPLFEGDMTVVGIAGDGSVEVFEAAAIVEKNKRAAADDDAKKLSTSADYSAFVKAQAEGKPLPEPYTDDMDALAAAERSGEPNPPANVGTIPKGGVRG